MVPITQVSSGFSKSTRSTRSEKSPPQNNTSTSASRFHRSPQTSASPISGGSTSKGGIRTPISVSHHRLKSKSSQQDSEVAGSSADVSSTSKEEAFRGFRTSSSPSQETQGRTKDLFLEEYTRKRKLGAAWHAVGSLPVPEKPRVQRVAKVRRHHVQHNTTRMPTLVR
eukprot:3925383-Pyramimonas_sp.AAC.2